MRIQPAIAYFCCCKTKYASRSSIFGRILPTFDACLYMKVDSRLQAPNVQTRRSSAACARARIIPSDSPPPRARGSSRFAAPRARNLMHVAGGVVVYARATVATCDERQSSARASPLKKKTHASVASAAVVVCFLPTSDGRPKKCAAISRRRTSGESLDCYINDRAFCCRRLRNGQRSTVVLNAS